MTKHIHVLKFHTREINETNSAISLSSCVFMSVNNQNSSTAWFRKKKKKKKRLNASKENL